MSELARSIALVTALFVLCSTASASDEPCERYDFIEHSVKSAPGVELFVRVGGSGEPALLVPGDFLLFDRLCELAGSRRVVFYDMRNRGRSSAVAAGDRLTLEADVRDLEAVRSRFGLDRPALLGYSYLGKMVVRYALAHPDAVSRIVQIGPVPMDPGRTFPPHLTEPSLVASGAFDDLVADIRARRAEGLSESDPEAYCELEWRLARQGLVGDPANAAGIPSRCHLPNEWPTRLVFHMRHHFQESMLHAIVTPIEAAELEGPVLTIHGTRDRNAPYGGGREWAASLPGARLLTMEGMGHAVHRETDLLPTLETFLSGRWPAGVESVEAAADGPRSQLQARDFVKAALGHHAPGDLPTEGALEIEWRGTLRPRSQSRTSEPPFEPPFPLRWKATLGADGERLILLEELQWPNFLSRYRSVVAPGEAFDVDLTSGAVSPPFRDPDDLLARTIRNVPALLLAEILTERASSLRFLGVVDLDGEPTHAISALHRGTRLDLHLGADGSLVAWGRMTSEPMLGDAYELLQLSGTTTEAGLRLPSRIARTVEGLGVSSEVELVSARWRQLDPALLERPAPAEERTETAASPSEPPAAGPERLADAVFLVAVPGTPDYQSLVVERDDHLVLVEAPVSEEATGRLLEILAESFPGKPIRFVIATHHHFDHSGGVPAAVAAGATLVTTPGNVAFFRRAITGPRTLENREPAAPPEIRTAADRWFLPGGPPAVEILVVEPTEHAEEMLAVHLPEAGLLFQGDLVRFPLPPDEPLRPQVEALQRLLDSRDLDIERIAGVHGEVGTPEALDGRLSEGDPGQSPP